ncbi:SDR family NAD(P)-dependent oxidoreductase [Streptomyces sp. 7-21]|uniref:SDR family NAD(P)-dependent oxidoreductase n=1 Tax=Streptomyces sp. 7-21 TaxID=2802283 RepID=UPI00191F07B7|nr:SDR family NAD(P)-dependent oxidoreductase [Streptomyces sp. 7-21]MBL1067582.1 SDR family NAD(P)-dependent oxidoreductase [Streptomyces sp. 7-21]
MRTILITGSTDGLGRHLAVRLARSGGTRVIVHGRSAERAAQVRAEITRAAGEDRADVLLADLSSLRETDRLADEVTRRYDRLDVLVNNAGIGSGPRGSGRSLTEDGIEARFAVNYLAGYHLTRRLLPLLTASAPSRVVNVASAGQRPVDFGDPMLERGYSGRAAYAQSKLAQIMFTFDLAAELRQRGADVAVNALHPATFMDTTMVREGGISPLHTVETGANATLRLIEGDHPGTGGYFDGTRPARAHDQAYDPEARRRLRELSDALIARARSAPA